MIRVCDNFVEDLAPLLTLARKTEFSRYGYSPVQRKEVPLPPSVKEAIERNLGPLPGPFQARLHYYPSEDSERMFIHRDPHAYTGILFLQGPEACGTTFFRHRQTNHKILPDTVSLAFEALEKGTDPRELVRPLSEDSFAPDRWEPWLRIPARPNRFLFFEGQHYHAPTSLYGTSPEEARLLLVVFFGEQNTAPPRQQN